MASIRAAQPDVRLASAMEALGGEPAEDLAQRTLMLAALQVHATRRAAQLPADALQAIGDGICPSCGRPPVASAAASPPRMNCLTTASFGPSLSKMRYRLRERCLLASPSRRGMANFSEADPKTPHRPRSTG